MRAILKIGLCAFALTAATLTDADELGRLFFTPEQRAQFDSSFERGAGPDNNGRALMLNGIVQKQGGKRTAWINGVPQAAGRSDDRSPESVPVPLPGQNKSVRLKVGQRVLLTPAASPDTTKPDAPDQDAPKQ